MGIKVLFCSSLLFILIYTCGGQSDSGFRLPRRASYFITAPQKVSPNQIIQISVTLMEMWSEHVNVRCIIRRNQEELTNAFQTFFNPGTTLMQLQVPPNAESGGNYTLRVEGSQNGGMSGFIFENETELIFDSKQVSVFIQPSKPLFRQGQKVMFRIMPIERNLMSRSGSMDVYIEDSTGTIVRRWLSMQTNAGGVLDMEFQLTEQPHYGVWKIKVFAFGHWYEEPFNVDEFYPYNGDFRKAVGSHGITAIDVNVSMPLYMMEDEFGLAGVISANLSLGQPAKGTCQVHCEIRLPLHERDPNKEYDWPTITKPKRYFPGVTDFLFTMDEFKNALKDNPDPDMRDPANKEIYVGASVSDWFLVQDATGGATTVIYKDEVTLKLLGDSARTFKPNKTMEVYFAAVHPDGTQLRRQRRQVTINRSERSVTGVTRSFEDKLLVGSDGILEYKFNPLEATESIIIRAYYDNLVSKTVELTAWRHFSPTDSYIYVITSTQKPTVDDYMVFTVTTTVWVEFIQYLITSSGNIVTGGPLEMNSRQKTFSVALSRDMIPEAHIIVWFVHKDEVVADSLNFFVNGTRINPVDIQFNRGKDFTGDTVEVNSWTDPSSFIGFNGIDYELWAYGWGTFITETHLIEELETYDSHVNRSFKHIWKMPEEQTEMVHYPAPSYGVDANTTFEYAGLLVFTDANVTRLPHNCNETIGWYPCMDRNSGCFSEDQRCDTVRQCWDGQDEMGCEYPDQDPFTPPRDRLGLLTRHYVMEGDWLWGGHFVMPNGRIDITTTVEDEPMSWVLGAFAISKDLGFGVVHNPARHQATRFFYMRAEAPSDAVKGEMIGVRIGLFNYWDQDLEAIIMLHDSDQYKFVIVEEFGIVSSYSPRTIRGDIQTMMFLEKGNVYEMHFPILPIVDGCIKVTISAYTFLYEDREELEICTKYDGVTNYLHTPFFVDLISTGSLVLPDLEIPVPERFIKPQERQHLYVPGSQEATVNIVGDVVGPGFFESYLDAENSLRKPYGAAEQNMYNFAANLYNLMYQKATNQLKETTQSTTLREMNLGFQRQLSYMNSDGSFSMFRDYQLHTPSVWVTSYVLRVFQEANVRDWELDFFVPVELMNKIALWLCDQQDTTGAFIENAPLYDRKMRGNLTDINGEMKQLNISMTAYVLITLATSNRLTGGAEICKNRAKDRALDYLEPFVPHLTDPYQTSLVTYALNLCGSEKATEALFKLDSMKIAEGHIYWADKPIPPNDIRMIDTIPYHQPRRWYDNEAYAVEATSYALLTYLRRNRITDSVPIMKWLQEMRNTNAGQASTQDSIMALKALVEYAKMDTNRALYNIEVTVQATSMGNFSKKVRLDRTNWAELQTVKINPVWGSVRGRAQGTGMALMQLVTKVNVEYPHQIKPTTEGKFFDIVIKEFSFTGKNFSIMEIMPCARWARPDISNTSGMSVIEIDVPTGYVVTNDVLRSYAQSGEVPALRRAEAYGRKVVFYLDYIESARDTCVKFRLDRWFPVANMTIQHKLKVYDYYEPGMHNTTLYDTWFLFNLHMCQVCGSFQCPYCRFYNSATTIPISIFISVLTSILGFVVSKHLTGT